MPTRPLSSTLAVAVLTGMSSTHDSIACFVDDVGLRHLSPSAHLGMSTFTGLGMSTFTGPGMKGMESHFNC